MAIERQRIFFEGRVQGVGFRMTVARLASRLPVVGFVRNLHDGRVELLVEGKPDSLEELVAAIEVELVHAIRGREVGLEPAGTPPLTDFSIR